MQNWKFTTSFKRANRFYCAMRTNSAAMLSQDVRLSVRPSVTCQFCIEMAKHVRLFSLSGSSTILAYPYRTLWQHSSANPINGVVECKGNEKITIFDQYIALSRNDTPMAQRNAIGAQKRSTEWCYCYWPWVTSSHCEIFSDTKHRAASLRLLSFLIIKPPLAAARAASCDGRVRLFACMYVCLSPNCKNAIFSKTKQFRAMVSTDDL